jgi:hypothetical protein
MKNKATIPDWLKSLQENSWELELLISGGAIFTLFQASDFIVDLSINISHNMGLVGNAVFTIIAIYAVKLLTLGFAFHLILRAFWVAMVFINFVYPSGVNSDKIRWKKPFKVDLDERSDLYIPIMNVDKLSGIVMFLSIMSTFVIIGLVLLLIVFALLPDTIGLFPLWFLDYIITTSLVLYVVDLLSFGFIRKIPILSYLVFPFFKLYDIISLRFIFERALLTYGTNVVKWKAVLFSMLFAIAALVTTYISVQHRMRWPNVFDDRTYRGQMADNYSLAFYADQGDDLKVSIPSKIINDNFLNVKVAYWVMDNKILESLDKPEEEKRFSDIIQIRIDDSTYASTEWYPFYGDEGRYGIESMIPIADLSRGKHILYIETIPELHEFIDRNSDLRKSVAIPFWKNE